MNNWPIYHVLELPRMKNWLVAFLYFLFYLNQVACSSQGSTPVAPTSTQSSSVVVNSGVTANGILLPARQISLSFGASGFLEELEVGIGDQVASGQVLANLNELEARLEVAVAQSALEAAKADYDLVVNDLISGEESAALALLEAQVMLDGLYEDAGLVRAGALNEIVSASKDLDAAQYRLFYFSVPVSLAGLEPLEALALARENLAKARADFEPYKHVSQNSKARQDLKEDLDTAQGEYNAAVRRLEMQVELVDAQARLEKFQVNYQNLQEGPDPVEVTLAEARVSEAQARLDLLDDKAASTQLALALAKVDAAQSHLEMVQAQLEKMTLVSPIDGVVSSIEFDVGEWVAPGVPVMELLDTSGWLVETKNVGELQIGRVDVGQSVRVQVNAFKGEALTGRVVSIAPTAVVQQGDITYTLIIELEPTDLNLRPGMNARVEILVNK